MLSDVCRCHLYNQRRKQTANTLDFGPLIIVSHCSNDGSYSNRRPALWYAWSASPVLHESLMNARCITISQSLSLWSPTLFPCQHVTSDLLTSPPSHDFWLTDKSSVAQGWAKDGWSWRNIAKMIKASCSSAKQLSFPFTVYRLNSMSMSISYPVPVTCAAFGVISKLRDQRLTTVPLFQRERESQSQLF